MRPLSNRIRAQWARVRTQLSALRHHTVSALNDFKNVASVLPSSRYAARSVVRHIPTGSAAVVEYGPGTGAITRPLLAHLPPQARLFAIEVNPRFQRLLESMGDPRLLVMRGRAAENLPPIQTAFPEGVDAVVSGIPFSLMPEEVRLSLVQDTHRVLKTGGKFILYQNSRLMVPYFKAQFSKVQVSFEPRNIFPYFIIVGTK